jgi:hypothetical protein
MNSLAKKWVLAATAILFAGPASATVIYDNNPFTWAGRQPVVRTLAMSAMDVLKAAEITSLPANGSKSPGQTLTFGAADTGFDFGFQLDALTVWPFTFRDDLSGPLGAAGLTAGEVQAQNGSDFDIRLATGRPVYAVGFNFIDNEGDPDALKVYGANGALLATIAGPFAKYSFMGVTADEPITRVFMDDDPVDISFFNGLVFGYVPEPSAAVTLGVGSSICMLWRRRGERR